MLSEVYDPHEYGKIFHFVVRVVLTACRSHAEGAHYDHLSSFGLYATILR